MTESADIVHALEAFVCDNPQLLELEQRLGGFNVFDALRITRTEIRHSNFLAWLLDPAETHGLGAMFLRPVLMDILRNTPDRPISPIALDGGMFRKLDIRREWRSIDLLIVSEEPSFVIAIENKIDSGEHSDQLVRYAAIVAETFPGRPTAYVFLTPGGEVPSDDRWTSYSYRQLYDVLLRTMTTNEAAVGDDVRVFLDHYLRLIGTRLMEDAKLDELCQTIFRNHRQAMEVLFERMPDPMSALLEQVKEIAATTDCWATFQQGKSTIFLVHNQWKEFEDLASHEYKYPVYGYFEVYRSNPRMRSYLTIGPWKDIERRKRVIDKLVKADLGLKPRGQITDKWTRLNSVRIVSISLGAVDLEEKVDDSVRKRLHRWDSIAERVRQIILETP